MPLQIVRNDITRMEVDAVVNAANSALQRGGGVCGAIFAASGAEQLQQECDRIGGCAPGQAVITSGGSLPATYIIHTVGPIWKGGSHGEQSILHSCYTNSLQLALKNKCRSIAFPLISSGIYGYPKDQALQVAIAAIGEFLLAHEITVYLVVYDNKASLLSEQIFSAIEKFIDDNYVEEHRTKRSRLLQSDEKQQLQEVSQAYQRSDYILEDTAPTLPKPTQKGKRKLEDIISHKDETFSQMLLRLIDQKGLTDVETYSRANIDRKLFSKIRSKQSYQPSKPTAIAFAIALRLNLDETNDLLRRAGYALSHSSEFDLIIEFFIREGNYNVFEINAALYQYDQSLLGA